MERDREPLAAVAHDRSRRASNRGAPRRGATSCSGARGRRRQRWRGARALAGGRGALDAGKHSGVARACAPRSDARRRRRGAADRRPRRLGARRQACPPGGGQDRLPRTARPRRPESGWPGRSWRGASAWQSPVRAGSRRGGRSPMPRATISPRWDASAGQGRSLSCARRSTATAVTTSRQSANTS